MKKIFLLLSLCVLFFSSCEEDIKLDIINSSEKIVIEGSIENGSVAEVIITRNSPLFATVDLANIVVYNAEVYVSNGLITDTLKMDTLFTTSNPFVYTGNNLVGQVGQVYYLTVVVDGKTYTAQTSIPNPIALDTLYWKSQPPEDTLGFAWAKLSEPIGIGNAYRWFAKLPTKIVNSNGNFAILNRRYLAPFGSTFDDKFIDGKTFEFAYNKPADPTETAFDNPDDNSYDGYYTNKDTVYIKFCTIDNATAKFYSTYESALQSNGNPFASPVTIISNLKGGALGVWAGYGATYDTIMPTP